MHVVTASSRRLGKRTQFRIRSTMVDSLSSARSSSPSSSSTLAWNDVVARFSKSVDNKDRIRILVGYGQEMTGFSKEDRTTENLVMGCAAQVAFSPRSL